MWAHFSIWRRALNFQCKYHVLLDTFGTFLKTSQLWKTSQHFLFKLKKGGGAAKRNINFERPNMTLRLLTGNRFVYRKCKVRVLKWCVARHSIISITRFLLLQNQDCVHSPLSSLGNHLISLKYLSESLNWFLLFKHEVLNFKFHATNHCTMDKHVDKLSWQTHRISSIFFGKWCSIQKKCAFSRGRVCVYPSNFL